MLHSAWLAGIECDSINRNAAISSRSSVARPPHRRSKRADIVFRHACKLGPRLARALIDQN
jgi:hypothetical protein